MYFVRGQRTLEPTVPGTDGEGATYERNACNTTCSYSTTASVGVGLRVRRRTRDNVSISSAFRARDGTLESATGGGERGRTEKARALVCVTSNASPADPTRRPRSRRTDRAIFARQNRPWQDPFRYLLHVSPSTKLKEIFPYARRRVVSHVFPRRRPTAKIHTPSHTRSNTHTQRVHAYAIRTNRDTTPRLY